MKKDRILLCYDCGERFAFPAKERAYYRRMKYREPCHCRVCRAVRREAVALESRRYHRVNRSIQDKERKNA